MKKSLPENFYDDFKNVKIKKGIKCVACSTMSESFKYLDLHCDMCQRSERRQFTGELEKEYKCVECRRAMRTDLSGDIYRCKKCKIDSLKSPNNFTKSKEIDLYDLMGLDFVMISPRHLFRAPYSLHEKTALASVVIDKRDILKFEFKDANPLTIKVRNFMPECEEEEAKQLVIEALDWAKENEIDEPENKLGGKYANYKPIKLKEIKEDNFPACVKNILKGLPDGKKRVLFVLINLCRSIGMEPKEIEKRFFEWDKRNSPGVGDKYIKAQLSWAYKRKPIMPPNCKEAYLGIGVCEPDIICNTIKNPVNYVVRKSKLDPSFKMPVGKKKVGKKKVEKRSTSKKKN